MKSVSTSTVDWIEIEFSLILILILIHSDMSQLSQLSWIKWHLQDDKNPIKHLTGPFKSRQTRSQSPSSSPAQADVCKWYSCKWYLCKWANTPNRRSPSWNTPTQIDKSNLFLKLINQIEYKYSIKDN